jgi:hypothetical protein
MDKNFKKCIIGFAILCILMLLNTCNSCNSSSNSKQAKQQIDSLRTEITDLKQVTSKLPTRTDLKIEGLRTEKRMIQSSDRKILDVNRQSDIDKEIEKIEKESENIKK